LDGIADFWFFVRLVENWLCLCRSNPTRAPAVLQFLAAAMLRKKGRGGDMAGRIQVHWGSLACLFARSSALMRSRHGFVQRLNDCSGELKGHGGCRRTILICIPFVTSTMSKRSLSQAICYGKRLEKQGLQAPLEFKPCTPRLNASGQLHRLLRCVGGYFVAKSCQRSPWAPRHGGAQLGNYVVSWRKAWERRAYRRELSCLLLREVRDAKKARANRAC